MTPAERVEYVRAQTARGFEVIQPGPYELLLDLDWMGHPVSRATHAKHMKELRKRIARLDQYIAIIKVEIKQSPFHYHGRVDTSQILSLFERQTFEMLLGSDPCRALHNMMHQAGPYAELLCTLPGPWAEVKWTKEDAK